MERKGQEHNTDLRFLLRAAASWLAAVFVLLPASASIITLADLKATSFTIFGVIVGALAALTAGYCAKRNSPMPGWQIALISGISLTIVLLTAGFLISKERMEASGILSVALVTILGCLFGTVLGSRSKKLQKRSRRLGQKKRAKLT